MPASPWRPSLDLRLAAVLLFVAVLNLPYLDGRVVPIHDTFYNFANFHVFYGEFFFHHDLPSWYPYGTYGLPSDFEQAASLSAFSYLAGLLGALLGVRDVLSLFKLAALGEQIAFASGVYLLARRLVRSPDTALALGVAAAGCVVWSVQEWWDLRLYYLLPLVLYFLVRFQETRRPEHFWLAGVAGVAWALGTTPYAVPLQALVVLVVFAVAVGRDLRKTVAPLASRAPAGLIALAMFALAAAAYVYFVPHSLDQTGLRAPFRDASGRVDLKTFRTYGGNANPVIVANAFLFGWPLQFQWGSSYDNSFYLGLLPILGLGFAVVRERSRFFVALVAAAVGLMLLSYGGAFTTLVYYLPGMAYYRHVALIYGLIKVLLLLASGYGIERIWSLGPPRFQNPVLLIVAGALLLEGVVAFPRLFEPVVPGHWTSSWGTHPLLRLCGYGALLALARFSVIPWRAAVVVGLALDLAVFQFVFYRFWAPQQVVRDPNLLRAVEVRAPYYQPERREEPVEPGSETREAELSQLAMTLGTHRVPKPLWQAYWYVYQFSQFDPCRSQYRTDYRPVGVERLLALEEHAHVDVGQILGCRTAKLRVLPRAEVVDSPESAEQALAVSMARPAVALVIQRVPDLPAPPDGSVAGIRAAPDGAAAPLPAAPDGTEAAGAAGTARVTDFRLGRLRADVQVEAPQGAWLVYDDAYYPGWRASVNGHETPVYPANLAFKAVRVPSGPSHVELWFDHGPNGVLRYVLAGFGAAWAFVFLVFVGRALLRRPEET